jgi:hypothetical protein
VTISRAYRASKWIVLAGIVSACNSTPPATSASQLPTFSGASPINPPTLTQVAPTNVQVSDLATHTLPPANQTWAERPFGTDKIVIAFYTDPNGILCVRYTIGAKSNTNCSPINRSTLVAVQGIEADSAGSVYSIVTGRTFTDKITAVSVEFTDGGNIPTAVEDGGFLVIVPGKRTAIWAIPIDQYGNLVGDKFTFKR